MINGNATQAEISRAFGVPLVTVKRYVKLYREAGAAAFFAPVKKRSASKLPAEVCQQAQDLLDQGLEVPEVGRQLGILANTLHKAIRAGRLRPGKKDPSRDELGSTKSQRALADVQTPLGRATTRSLDRVAASVGMLNGAAIEFERVQDVPDGGVLLALPALLVLGLLSKSRENFSMSEGFYPLESIFLVVALMALGRVASLEALRYEAPGEWGKLLGLDPRSEHLAAKDYRALRGARRRATLEQCSGQAVDGAGTRKCWRLLRRWACAGLSWKTDRSASALCGPGATLFARHHRLLGQCDGWTALFHGQLRGGSRFTDCDARADCAAAQRRCAQLAQRRRTASRSALKPFYDRLRPEAYSPDFFAQMKKQRVAVLTYRKFSSEPWAAQEFRPCRVRLINGEQVHHGMAERGVRLSNHLWVREVRHLTEKGHQSSILSTDLLRV